MKMNVGKDDSTATDSANSTTEVFFRGVPQEEGPAPGEARVGAEASPSVRCPKCLSGDIAKHFTWGAFGLAFIGLFIGAAILQSIFPPKQVGFQEQHISDTITTMLFVTVLWTFFSALIGKHRCKSCGHKWR